MLYLVRVVWKLGAWRTKTEMSYASVYIEIDAALAGRPKVRDIP